MTCRAARSPQPLPAPDPLHGRIVKIHFLNGSQEEAIYDCARSPGFARVIRLDKQAILLPREWLRTLDGAPLPPINQETPQS